MEIEILINARARLQDNGVLRTVVRLLTTNWTGAPPSRWGTQRAPRTSVGSRPLANETNQFCFAERSRRTNDEFYRGPQTHFTEITSYLAQRWRTNSLHGGEPSFPLFHSVSCTRTAGSARTERAAVFRENYTSGCSLTRRSGVNRRAGCRTPERGGSAPQVIWSQEDLLRVVRTSRRAR